ncbi:MAG: metal-binding protein [Cyclobacteriaceae bacterium]|nr:metal-binding protein [Cyclobacteriaceae bacterium]
MILHRELTPLELKRNLRLNTLTCAGNERLKIYGRLDCKSGKRMKKENRVFFASEHEAIQAGYRPCGHCMKKEFTRWKRGLTS